MAVININNQNYEYIIKDYDTLLEILRYKLNLIGTKQGCDKGDCGACTVLINNKPVLSCLTLAQNITSSQKIQTIENYSQNKLIKTLVNNFEQTGALQCGFCQPGMILSAYGLLKNNSTPTLGEIKLALSGNLCRCTGYTKIYEAILITAEQLEHNHD